MKWHSINLVNYAQQITCAIKIHRNDVRHVGSLLRTLKWLAATAREMNSPALRWRVLGAGVVSIQLLRRNNEPVSPPRFAAQVNSSGL